MVIDYFKNTPWGRRSNLRIIFAASPQNNPTGTSGSGWQLVEMVQERLEQLEVV